MKSECVTVILDNVPNKSKGHFTQLAQDVCRSYQRSQRKCLLVTHNSLLLDLFDQQVLSYVKVRLVPESEKKSIFEIVSEHLLRNMQSGETRIHLFVLRSNTVQLNDFDEIKNWLDTYENLDLTVLTNISGIISESLEAESERRILEKFRSLRNDVTFLAWDQRVEKNKDFLDTRFLPEVKPARARLIHPEKTTVGFYGKLSSERGLFRLLFSVFLNPKLEFRIMGYGFNARYLFRSKKFVSLKKTPGTGVLSLIVNFVGNLALRSRRVVFEEKYFNNENEMALELQKCSAVYFSCANSPYSSGLVYQALSAGVPVVWSDGDSAMAFVLREHFPKGRIDDKDLFRFGGLTNFVKNLEGVTPTTIFQQKDFDDVLNHCNCEGVK